MIKGADQKRQKVDNISSNNNTSTAISDQNSDVKKKEEEKKGKSKDEEEKKGDPIDVRRSARNVGKEANYNIDEILDAADQINNGSVGGGGI